jgi:formylglycine-generating enzyme required for sulfatase activity
MSERVDPDLVGLHVVFTGALEEMTRAEAERQARELGAVVGSSVSKKTQVLVAGARVGATKLNAAQRHGVRILTEADWLELVSRVVSPQAGGEIVDRPVTSTEVAGGVVDLGPGGSMRLVEIPAGRFLMGSPESEADRWDDETQHEVTISKAFWLGQTPVTQAQWQAVMGSNPSRFKGPNRPVEQVTWFDAVHFCNVLSELAGLTPHYRVASIRRGDEGGIIDAEVELIEGANGYRLPTEAEWEYACRAGTTTAFSFGDDESMLAKHAWFDENSGFGTHPVATKRSNAWGLFDMHGNVWDWCSDWYDAYPSGAVTDPQGPRSGTLRVLRGGSWFGFSRPCRAAFRLGRGPAGRDCDFGFRVARTP